jgi:hypothetical protein
MAFPPASGACRQKQFLQIVQKIKTPLAGPYATEISLQQTASLALFQGSLD